MDINWVLISEEAEFETSGSHFQDITTKKLSSVSKRCADWHDHLMGISINLIQYYSMLGCQAHHFNTFSSLQVGTKYV